MAQCSTNSFQEHSIGFFQKPAEFQSVDSVPDQQDFLRSSLPAICKMLENLDKDKILSLASTLPENCLPSLMRNKREDAPKMNLEPKKKTEQNELKKSGFLAKVLPKVDFRNLPSKNQIPRYSLVEFHEHPDSEKSRGLLQICCDEKKSVYHVIDNKVREMDKILINPANSICRDTMDSSCELQLPGPYKFQIKPKSVALNSNRYTLDVLGLFIILVDVIYATGSVSHVMYGGVKTPLEFTQDVVKIITILKSTFPSLFEELQKMIMYSTVANVMKKLPFKWNRCMTFVLEDLIVHPIDYVNEESIEFKLLTVMVNKRAKALFKQLEVDSTKLSKISLKYKSLLNSQFSKIVSKEIKAVMLVSAENSLKIHRVKNIRYKIHDEYFIKVLKLVWCSYNC